MFVIVRRITVLTLSRTGAGRAFCAGAELGAKDEAESNPLEFHGVEGEALRAKKVKRLQKLSIGESINRNMVDLYNPLMRAFYGVQVPIVVGVNGIAAGGGLGLALVGDIVLATEHATFLSIFAPKLG